MTSLYLLDKSALARVSRETSVREALERLDDIGILATTAVTDLEIGYSTRNLAEFDSITTTGPRSTGSFRSPAPSRTEPVRSNASSSAADNTADPACRIC